MPQISLVMQASNLDRPNTAKAALPPFISPSKEKQWGLVLSQHDAPGGPKTCCPKTLREILVSQMRLNKDSSANTGGNGKRHREKETGAGRS